MAWYNGLVGSRSLPRFEEPAMNENGRRQVPWVDGDLFNKNLNKQPAELFIHHAGQFAAWSLDGTRLIETAPSREELFGKLDAAGIFLDEVVQGYIDPPDESQL